MEPHQTPEQILESAWARVAAVHGPVASPPGDEWHFATGAQWALGTAGLLSPEQIERWEAVAQREAHRLAER